MPDRIEINFMETPDKVVTFVSPSGYKYELEAVDGELRISVQISELVDVYIDLIDMHVDF